MASPRFVFASHDGFGLGHVRRSARLATALRSAVPDAEITIFTGIESHHAWLDESEFSVVRVPSLVKDSSGHYRNRSVDTRTALAERARIFASTIADLEPDAVVIDRHPLGINGELRTGLEVARRRGTRVILGLRDVIDEPTVVRAEMTGPAWRSAYALIDQVLVYGSPLLCDHMREYGLGIPPTYCGWVGAEMTTRPVVDPGLLVVTAGGGSDGADVLDLGCSLASHQSVTRAQFVLGPASTVAADVRRRLRGSSAEVQILPLVEDCAALYAGAGAVVQMAGYNSTVEALSSGTRPIFVPRRAPRREQAIRATRLASLGLADVVDVNASCEEIAWLLDRPRRLDPNALDRAGIDLTGAARAAGLIASASALTLASA